MGYDFNFGMNIRFFRKKHRLIERNLADLSDRMLAGWSRQTMLTRAAWFAASICGIRGAVPAEADFYDDFL